MANKDRKWAVDDEGDADSIAYSVLTVFLAIVYLLGVTGSCSEVSTRSLRYPTIRFFDLIVRFDSSSSRRVIVVFLVSLTLAYLCFP